MKLLIILVVIVVIVIISTINQIIYLKNRANRSKSVIDVYLKKRYDLIPNLVETVKGYTTHEEKLLTEITKLRTDFLANENDELKERLNEDYSKLIALVENYPDLKASENFLQLQKSLSKVESELQAARRMYVNDATNYNTKIKTFPNLIFASIMGCKEMELLKFEEIEVKVEF